MGVSKEVIERYPISPLVFILTAGLFTVLSFPYDIFSYDFSHGLKLSDVPTFFSHLGENFAPFVNAKQLSMDFVLGSTKIFLASLMVGTLFYLCFGLYQRINGCIVKGRIRKKIYSWKEITLPVKQDTKTALEFSDWLAKHNFNKEVDFIVSMRMVTVGLLYASETLLLIVLVVCWLWVGLALGIGVISYLLYLLYDVKYMKDFSGFRKTFDESRSKTKSEKADP